MKRLLLLLFITAALNAQDIDDIKKSDEYIWGEGVSRTLRKADRIALDDLISQISVQIESQFTDILSEENGNLQEFTKSIINTYSSTTLNQANRKVEEKRGKTTVLRYIKKADMKAIFVDRKNKIIDYTKSALNAEKELRIADALKYYYWSLVLLRSHPDHNTIKMQFPEEGERLLLTALPDRINRIFTFLNIDIETVKKNQVAKNKSILLNINYRKQPVQNLDYIYWTGDSWTRIESCKDGVGFVELYGEAVNLPKLRLKIEYVFERKSKMDQELWMVIENIEDIPYFSKADFEISLKWQKAKPEKQIEPEQVTVKDGGTNTSDKKIESATDIIYSVIKGIRAQDYSSIKNHFTDQGYDIFERIIKYGNAKIIDDEIDLNIVELDSSTILRSLKMRFDFPNNDRTFLEDVNFTMNADKKIDGLSFALSQIAIKDILNKGERFGSTQEKYYLINFMENYKTAYCLERLDYIKSVFADNALIIVGSMLQVDESIGEMYQSLGKKVNYIRMTKQEYIERLSHIFNANEFVNIHFEKNDVKKIAGDKKIYGIQIEQNYYSANYADKGYLFLMFDLSDSTRPKIYVRTWQPEKNLDGSVYGLKDFHF